MDQGRTRQQAAAQRIPVSVWLSGLTLLRLLRIVPLN